MIRLKEFVNNSDVLCGRHMGRSVGLTDLTENEIVIDDTDVVVTGSFFVGLLDNLPVDRLESIRLVSSNQTNWTNLGYAVNLLRTNSDRPFSNGPLPAPAAGSQP